MSKKILITGGSRGIGLATAERYWREPGDVSEVILLARDSGEFEDNAQALRRYNPLGKRLHTYTADVGDRPQLIKLMDEIFTSHGNIDLLVNNAGYTSPNPIHQISFDDFQRTMDVNLYAPFTIVQELLHHGNRFEFIANVASTAGVNGRSGWLTYSSSKAALINMSEVMKEELAIYGTRVVCVSPGRTATDLRRVLAPDEDPSTIMQPHHVAEVIYTLASEVGRYLDSQNLVVRL